MNASFRGKNRTLISVKSLVDLLDLFTAKSIKSDTPVNKTVLLTHKHSVMSVGFASYGGGFIFRNRPTG
jgi:hypothetical protein